MKIEEISKVKFVILSNFSFSFSGDHVMRMRIKVVPVAGHLNADRDLGGRVTDLEYHGQIPPLPPPTTVPESRNYCTLYLAYITILPKLNKSRGRLYTAIDNIMPYTTTLQVVLQRTISYHSISNHIPYHT